MQANISVAPIYFNVDVRVNEKENLVDDSLKILDTLFYNPSGYPQPRSTLPKPLLQIQKPCILRTLDKNYNPVFDYGYPPPPKPPPLPDLSPLCSPCPSPAPGEESDDENLLDIDNLPSDNPEKSRQQQEVLEAPLEPPPLPPEFPWPAKPLSPPPIPPEFPWNVPRLPPSTSTSRNSPQKPPSPPLPEALQNLCQSLFCKLCTVNLPSKTASEYHYNRNRRHKVRVNKWLRDNDYTEFLLYVPPKPKVKKKFVSKTKPAASHSFEWKGTGSMDAITDPHLPQHLRHLCQTLICSICNARHFSRTHAIDHYSSHDHRFEVLVYLGLAKRPLLPTPSRKTRKKKAKRSYWSWIKKHHLGTYAANKPKMVQHGDESNDNHHRYPPLLRLEEEHHRYAPPMLRSEEERHRYAPPMLRSEEERHRYPPLLLRSDEEHHRYPPPILRSEEELHRYPPPILRFEEEHRRYPRPLLRSEEEHHRYPPPILLSEEEHHRYPPRLLRPEEEYHQFPPPLLPPEEDHHRYPPQLRPAEEEHHRYPPPLLPPEEVMRLHPRNEFPRGSGCEIPPPPQIIWRRRPWDLRSNN